MMPCVMSNCTILYNKDFIAFHSFLFNPQEKMELRDKLDAQTVDENAFVDDAKVRYYTGLPNFLTFITLFNFIAPYIHTGSRSVLTKFQQFVVTMMRFRLNLAVQDLAYR